MPSSNPKKSHSPRSLVSTGAVWSQGLARLLILASLLYTPWAFGSTVPEWIEPLDDTLLAAFGLHLLALILQRRPPRYPLLPTACFIALILQSAWMVLNARSYLDDDYWEFVSLVQLCPGLPGTWDKADSFFALKSLCAMTAAFLITSDAMVDPSWRSRLWRTMALTGCTVILYGMLVKALGRDSALAMYHEPANVPIPTFFGPYRYHANAGAYLNLIWPVLLALFVQSWRDREAYVGRAGWSLVLLLGLAACFVNTSKAAAVITLIMMITSLFAFGSFFWKNLSHSRTSSRVIAGGFLLLLITILVYGGLTRDLQTRWHAMFLPGEAGDTNGRLIVDRVCLGMIPEAGWFGFGPGTFSKVFPFHTLALGDEIRGFWVYAHNDYLQTVIEYGYWGTVLWAVLLFGSILRAIWRGTRLYLRTNDRIVYRACALALGGIALHALVDFPLQIASLQLYVMIFFAYAWGGLGLSRTEALEK